MTVDRIAAKSLPPNSFPLTMKKARDNTPCARLTIFGGLTCYAMTAEELFVAPTSQHWTANTTSSISLVQSAQPFSVHKIAITSTLGKSIVTTTTRPNLRNDVKAARQLSSSNSWRSSETEQTSTGIPNAT